jgi:hypothetical protein
MFGRDISLTNLKTTTVRSVSYFGGPINVDGIRYKDKFDRSEDQKKYYLDW